MSQQPSFQQSATASLLQHKRSDGRRVMDKDVPRFLKSLELISGISPKPVRVCDLGTFGGLEPALVDLFGISDITTTGYPEPHSPSALTFVDERTGRKKQFSHTTFDLEENFPLKDADYDLVILTEVLEHVSRDPMLTMSEINRITKDNGYLLISVPNCVALASTVKALRGGHPYMWSSYPQDGTRDRHNREYTPGELRSLVVASGYKVQELVTFNAYSGTPSLAQRLAAVSLGLIRSMISHSARFDWDGQIVFCLAQKVGPVTDRYPHFLYS